jgi:hypothetical protein
MKRTLGWITVVLAMTAAVFSSAFADDGEKYLLRYQFHPGETVRWEVEQRTQLRTTVSGSTQTAETTTRSLKAWRVSNGTPEGVATFEHSVEWVDMRQQLSECAEVRYDSRTDAKPPAGFDDVAKSVGVPLSTVTMDAKGKILKRERRDVKALTHNEEGCMTIPLPDEAVPVGYTWSCPQDIDVPLETGGVKKIRAIQQFTLEGVKTGVATIRVSTEIITPINDPAVEVKLTQRDTHGRVRFDLEAGRILGQQMDSDKHVVGFRGEASSMHNVTRFTEQILPQEIKTAEKKRADVN